MTRRDTRRLLSGAYPGATHSHGRSAQYNADRMDKTLMDLMRTFGLQPAREGGYHKQHAKGPRQMRDAVFGLYVALRAVPVSNGQNDVERGAAWRLVDERLGQVRACLPAFALGALA